ncbi:3-oxoacyl-ACP reductase [Enterococcus cecorum]|uniref:3-oxoacyl-ACP reductase n=1 Tax=Enterococcus cecorum TaxID=44008 RepID=UPI0006412F99|nr:3-oxoacyl-ACP reductase [Enterococcus cecorum]KLN91407.1 3-ketoacyl-ACP reductase [Enterococcus cecorum]KLN92545.1 3-ketoacyl-ACP reductase [Enterococcus cecorum]
MSEFKEKVVLVTGVASGIGLAQAKIFLANGAKVFGVDCQEMPENLADSPRFVYFQGDVSDSQVCKQAVEKCCQHFGKVDILLNTAGVLDNYATIAETSIDQWHQVLRTNLDSMFYFCKLVIPKMIQAGGGVVINMASVASLVAGGGGVSYTASKHAIAGLTKQLAYDHGKDHISVKAIAPGAIQTPMNAADFAGDGAMAKWVAEETPVKRWAQAAEVAELTLFLASEKSSYLHGAIVPFDGGWTIK